MKNKGNKKGNPEEVKDKSVNTRFNLLEYIELQEKVEKAGLSQSDFIRHAVRKNYIIIKKVDKQDIKEAETILSELLEAKTIFNRMGNLAKRHDINDSTLSQLMYRIGSKFEKFIDKIFYHDSEI